MSRTTCDHTDKFIMYEYYVSFVKLSDSTVHSIYLVGDSHAYRG